MSEPSRQGTEILKPYVPRLVLNWLRETPDATFREVDGSMVFVDISGFTKMSERLARHGKVGAEEVTDVLGAVFSRLLAVAYANGGGLLKFGGDALLLWFSGDEHAVRGARAAHGMRATLRSVGKIDTTAGKVTLRMSIGVNSGRFHFFLVGGSHREFIVTGPAATGTVQMEGTATAGEILLGPSTAAQLPEKVLGAAKGEGRLLRSEPPGLSLDATESEVPVGNIDLLPFISVGLREGILAGTEPEHRAATVAFVHFDGTDELIHVEGPEAAAAALDELVRDVQEAVDDAGVCFLSSDVDADGGKLILTAGVPRVLGDDEERMLLALRRIAEGDRRIPIRIGANRGAVFSGDVGPPYRRTYTVMGDPVNLAARLMAKAPPGEVYATAGVLEASQTLFDLAELEPFLVKGKAKPVRAWSVGPPVGSRTREASLVDLPLEGRSAEVDALRAALDRSRDGQVTLVEIVGEPGIGKSRLLKQLQDDSKGFTLLHATCEAYTASTAYVVWRELLRELLGLRWEDPDHVVVERVSAEVASRVPDLVPWVPLIVVAFDATMPPTPEVESIAEVNRRGKLHDVVGQFLRTLLPEPTLIEVEDAHHMDEASVELFAYLSSRIDSAPWLIAISHRATESGFRAPEGIEPVRLQLEPLAEEAAFALAQAATEAAPLLPHDLQLVVHRSAGNPQFLLDLVAAVAAGSDLPDSVEAAATARIDQLAPLDRSIVRRASILGLSFHAKFVDDVLEPDTPRPDERTWGRLAEFFEDDGDGYVRYRRAVVREAAYDGLPFRTRRELHRVVGERLEREVEDPDEAAGVLSLHFLRASAFDKAWRYARTAADRAKEAYANEEAARLYQRAIDAGRRLPDVGDVELTASYDEMSEALRRAGQFRKAATANAVARRLAKQRPLTLARLLHRRSILEDALGHNAQALRWATRARRILEEIPGAEAATQLAQLTSWYAEALQIGGRAKAAITWSERAIEQARTIGDRDALWVAYDTLDWAKFTIGESTGGLYMRLALEVAEEMGDLRAQARVVNGLGFLGYYEGRWTEALEFFERSRVLNSTIGDPTMPAVMGMNIAEIYCERGNLDEAEAILRDSLRVLRASGYRYYVAGGLVFLGRVAARAHRFDEALEAFDEARALFADVGAPEEIVEVTARAGECRALMGDGEGALELIDEALARTEGTDTGGQSLPLIHRTQGYALAQLGRLDEARAAFEGALDAARARGQDLDVALTLHALARLSGTDGSARSVEAGWERDSILERLGVEAVAEVPLTPTQA